MPFNHDVKTSPCSASHVGCQRDTARICCSGAVLRRRCSRAPARALWAASCSRRAVQQAPVLSSKPAARSCCGRSTGHTDGRAVGRTLDHFVDPSPHGMRAVSINGQCSMEKNTVQDGVTV